MRILTNLDYENIDTLSNIFSKGKPSPSIIIENFFHDDVALSLNDECQNSNDAHWKVFTRNGSHMIEYNNIQQLPKAYEAYSYLHSGPFLKWLEQLTGINGLIPDPHLIGAGYSRSFKGDTLKVHTDFNWNNELKLYRVLSLIVYLTPGWKEEWGGGLDFYNEDRTEVVKTLPCLFNNCAIWKYEELGFHGYTTPISCPDGNSRNSIRAFYYVSDGEYKKDFTPHRSLYWFDENTKKPFDKREEI
jgi:Rps23 Pro-64 3,4-dihydroxylase Tpa1-like proline 4-hydroxylase